MTTKLSTSLSHIEEIPNSTNRQLVREFSEYLQNNSTSDAYRSQMIKIMNTYANDLGLKVNYNIDSKDQITTYLNSKIRSPNLDPDKKWITTWNDSLAH